MINFSYTKSPTLQDKLDRIDFLRKDILLISLSPREELELKWKTLMEKISYTIAFTGNIIEERQIEKLLSPLGKKNRIIIEQNVISYKTTTDYLHQHWLITDALVTIETLEQLYKLMYRKKIIIEDEIISKGLTYIQSNPEHPITQAALAHILVVESNTPGLSNEAFATIVSQLFLYKNGYEMMEMLSLAKSIYLKLGDYRKAIITSVKQDNLTGWLEFFSDRIIESLEDVLRKIHLVKQGNHSSISLTSRQDSILASLDKPGSTITNKDVQKKYDISQITASRELAHLASLGLLFPVGKGRSTRYTRT